MLKLGKLTLVGTDGGLWKLSREAIADRQFEVLFLILCDESSFYMANLSSRCQTGRHRRVSWGWCLEVSRVNVGHHSSGGLLPVVRVRAKLSKEKADEQTKKKAHFFPFFCYDSEIEKWKEEKTPLIVPFLSFTKFPNMIIQWLVASRRGEVGLM